MASPLKTPDPEWRALVDAVASEANRWRSAEYSRVERSYHPESRTAESTTSSRTVRIPASADLTPGSSLPSALSPLADLRRSSLECYPSSSFLFPFSPA
jgi:hypothetical protein